jgi:hypothetical protein
MVAKPPNPGGIMEPGGVRPGDDSCHMPTWVLGPTLHDFTALSLKVRPSLYATGISDEFVQKCPELFAIVVKGFFPESRFGQEEGDLPNGGES